MKLRKIIWCCYSMKWGSYLTRSWFKIDLQILGHILKSFGHVSPTFGRKVLFSRSYVLPLCVRILFYSLCLCWPHHNQVNGHIISRQSKSAVFAAPYHIDQNLCLILCGWHCVPWVSGKGRTLSGSNIDLSLRWERIWIQHWSLGGSPLVSLEAALNIATIVYSFSHPHL